MTKSSLILSIIFFSCSHNQLKEAKATDTAKTLKARKNLDSLVTKPSKPVFDHTLAKPKYSYIFMAGDSTKDSMYLSCRCEKNVRDNRIIIQLQTGNLNYPRTETFLHFYLKDSIMEKADIFRRSQELQSNGRYFDMVPIEKYTLSLTKSKYNIAQNIWGYFEVEIPAGFIHFPGVKTLKGGFTCNNMEVWTFNIDPELPQGNTVQINKNISFPEKSKTHILYDYRCDCAMNSGNSKLIIENSWGDGLAGENLKISISKSLKASFLTSSWTDCCDENEFYHEYHFNRYKLELNKNPFTEGVQGLTGKYWIATEPASWLYGERRVQKAFFICR
jgi:hypothetical protein